MKKENVFRDRMTGIGHEAENLYSENNSLKKNVSATDNPKSDEKLILSILE